MTPPKDPALRPGPRPPVTPKTPGQVGRRPSSPLVLFGIGLAWVAVGIIIVLTFHASWRIVPGVFALGVGAFFVRGASATVVRHERRRGG